MLSVRKIHTRLIVVFGCMAAISWFLAFDSAYALLMEHLDNNMEDVSYHLEYFNKMASLVAENEIFNIPTSVGVQAYAEKQKNAINFPLANRKHYAAVSYSAICSHVANNGIKWIEVKNIKSLSINGRNVYCRGHDLEGREIVTRRGHVFRMSTVDFFLNIIAVNYKAFTFSLLLAGVFVVVFTHDLRLAKKIYAKSSVEIQKHKKIAHMDYLSGLQNRRGFVNNAGKALENSVVLFILDVDFFKKINDTYGHSNGDLVIKSIGKVLQKLVPTINSVSCVSRFGGEEFCGILKTTDFEHAKVLIDNMRNHFSNLKIPLKNSGVYLSLTVSIGAAYNNCANNSLSRLMDEADVNLYFAKNTGRDKTHVTCV